MKTKQELLQKIDDDLIWRRRELTDFRALIQNESTQRKSALIRAGVALLYAHWEGFIKYCGTQYLIFVSQQRKKASELQRNFLAVKLQTQLAAAKASSKASANASLIDFFCTQLDSRMHIPHKGVIDTKSNLSSSVFQEIIWTLGLNMGPFETKRNLIDSSLVNRRNHIAHGNVIDIEIDDYLGLHDNVMELLDEFRTQVQNAAVMDSFVRPKSAAQSPTTEENQGA